MGTTDGEVLDGGQRLAQAGTALRAERRRTADEVQALRSFETRVRDIETTARVAAGRPAARANVVAGGTDGLEAVRDAYEATVMAVPHYESEYDDSYVESLAAEFSPDLAAALTDGTRFNARCKDALISAVDGSRSARGRLLELLAAESDSLEAAAETLRPLSAELSDLEDRAVGTAPYGMLDAYGARLAVLDRKCETVAETRQATLFEQRRTSGLPTDAPDVPQYVYQTLPFDYPVMATVADCSAAIGRLRDDVDAAMDAAGPDPKRAE
jgi:hypothetical protein